MSKHTPGPWKLAADGSAFVYRLDPQGLVNVFSLSITPGWESLHGERTSGDELLANARLIAAAPELLKLLRALADIPLEDFGWGEHRPDQPITGWNRHTLYVRDVLAARAAIAKATGAA